MKKNILAVLVMVGFIAGCASFPKDDIQVETEADPKVNFSGYKTYAWLGSIGIVKDPEGLWEPPQFDADAEIVFLIDSALRKRGITEVSENPDMLVAYAIGVEMDALKLKHNPETKITSLENVPQTGLIVVLIDPETEFATWVGIATGEIKNLDADTAKKRLKYVVDSMFKGMPK
ncbi:DUF4136 domain-containing protein [Kaarinaea lacus]